MAKTIPFPGLKFTSQQPPPKHICLDTSFIVPIFFNPHGKLSTKEQEKTNACNDFLKQLNANSVIKVITTNVVIEMFDQILEYEIIQNLWTNKGIPYHIARRIWRDYLKHIAKKGSINSSGLKAHFDKLFAWVVRNQILILSDTKKYIDSSDIENATKTIFTETVKAKQNLKLSTLLDPIRTIFTEKEKTIEPSQDLKDLADFITDSEILSDDAKIIYQAINNDFFVKVNNFVSLDKDFTNVNNITVYYYPL